METETYSWKYDWWQSQSQEREVEKLFQIKGVGKHMITKCNAPRLDQGLPC